jgi:hypothetical protein
MRRLLLTSIPLSLSIAGVADAAPQSGVYSSVCLYPETDDLGGIELSLDVGAKPAVVRLITCAGGCWQQPTSNVRVMGKELAFSARDESFDSNGKLVESVSHQFVAKFEKRALKLWSDDSDMSGGKLILSSRKPSRHDASITAPIRRCHK